MNLELTVPFYGKSVGGQVNLSRYPNLVYTPAKGVMTHLAGRTVEEIGREISLNPGLMTSLDDLAGGLGLTLDELCDALRYARSTGLI